MSGILSRCQQAIGHWVGSSVVHLGDHNVPNALFFLNKYTQVRSCFALVLLSAVVHSHHDHELFVVEPLHSCCQCAQRTLLGQ
jgi:hypothetical protein